MGANFINRELFFGCTFWGFAGKDSVFTTSYEKGILKISFERKVSIYSHQPPLIMAWFLFLWNRVSIEHRDPCQPYMVGLNSDRSITQSYPAW